MRAFITAGPSRLSATAAAKTPRPRPWVHAMATAAAVLGLVTACGSVTAASPATAAPPAGDPAACTSGTCYVAVSVATLWVRPWYPRTIDKPALGNPAHPLTWVGAMTVAQKSWLVGRLETQGLYGTKVTVIGHWHNWTKVAVPSQPTNRDPRGYPGWVPTAQLTRTAPPAAATSAVIGSPTAWLWTAGTASIAGTRVTLASYDIRLPVVRATATYVEVTLIGGRKAAVRRSNVVLHAAGSSWGVTRARVIAEARDSSGCPTYGRAHPDSATTAPGSPTPSTTPTGKPCPATPISRPCTARSSCAAPCSPATWCSSAAARPARSATSGSTSAAGTSSTPPTPARSSGSTRCRPLPTTRHPPLPVPLTPATRTLWRGASQQTRRPGAAGVPQNWMIRAQQHADPAEAMCARNRH